MGYVQEARDNHVKKKVEEALRSKMKQKALKECDRYASKYAECSTGRTISVVWHCRKQARELNECLHQLSHRHCVACCMKVRGKFSKSLPGAAGCCETIRAPGTLQIVQLPSQNPPEAIPGNPMQPAPAAPTAPAAPSAPAAPITHFPPTSAMPPFPASSGQNILTNQYITGQPTQWTWQPIPVGNQFQHGLPPFQPGQIVPPFGPQSSNNSSQSPYPPNIFPAQTIMIQVPPTAVQSPWTTGLFDCLDDPLIAAVACLFPFVTFGQITEIVDSGSMSCATGAILYGGIQFLIGLPCLISCSYRTRLRAKFNLTESPAPDWITHFFCECCALAQEYRELKNRGYDPAIGWQGNVAIIRSVQQHQLAMVPPMNQTMRG